MYHEQVQWQLVRLAGKCFSVSAGRNPRLLPFSRIERGKFQDLLTVADGPDVSARVHLPSFPLVLSMIELSIVLCFVLPAAASRGSIHDRVSVLVLLDAMEVLER